MYQNKKKGQNQNINVRTQNKHGTAVRRCVCLNARHIFHDDDGDDDDDQETCVYKYVCIRTVYSHRFHPIPTHPQLYATRYYL